VQPPDVFLKDRNSRLVKEAGVTARAVYTFVALSQAAPSSWTPEISTVGCAPQVAENAIFALDTGSQSITTPKSSCVGQPVVASTVQFSSHGVFHDPK
jgi:hypothetical protein